MITVFLALLWVGLLPRADNTDNVEAAARDLQNPLVAARMLALRRLAKLPADEAALEPLMSALTDLDPAVRLEAVKTWGVVGKSYDLAELALLKHLGRGKADPEAWYNERYKAWTTRLFELLQKNTTDSTPALARESLRTIALLGDSVQLLLFDQDELSEVENNCLEPAGKCLADISKEHLTAVTALLQDKNPNVVYNAVCALRRAHPQNDRIVQPILRRFLTDHRPEWRVIALEQLEQEPEAEYVRRLLPLFGDEDERVRQCAIKYTGRSEDKTVQQAIAPLVAEFANSSVPLRRSIIALAGEQYEQWERAALLDVDGGVRADAIEALADRNVKFPVSYLMQQICHPDPRVRAEATKALGNHEAMNDPTALMPLLHDPDTDVRDAAIEAIAYMHEPRTIEPLLEALLRSADKDEYVSDAVIEGLRGIGKSAVPLIRQLLTNANPRVHLVAIRAGCRILPEAASDFMEAALQDRDSRVRLGVVNDILRRRDISAAGSLLPLLRDSDEEVRKTVISALGIMRITSSQTELKAILKNDKEDDDTYYAAWFALKEINSVKQAH